MMKVASCFQIAITQSSAEGNRVVAAIIIESTVAISITESSNFANTISFTDFGESLVSMIEVEPSIALRVVASSD